MRPAGSSRSSGDIKIGASLVAIIADVLVKAGDKVLAGEPLVRLSDKEGQARVANAQAQVAMRKRARDDQAPSSRAADRRRAEDAIADGKRSLGEAQVAFDRAVIEWRAGRGSAAELDAARSALTRAQERLTEREAELRKVEADTSVPLPTQTEGQLNLARAELWPPKKGGEDDGARADCGHRAAGQCEGGRTRLALFVTAAGAPRRHLALRVRAGVDERDFSEIKIGQSVLVRPAAFRGREVQERSLHRAPGGARPNNPRLQRNQTDVDVVEVLVDLAEPGPLAVGMKADVYFRPDAAQR